MRFPALIIITCFGLTGFRSGPRSFVPPGTVRINDSLFFDAQEITNLSWIEYMYWTAQAYGKSSRQFLSTFPDTAVWAADSLKTLYLRHPRYRQHPVVGISYAQAKAFADWRTARVKQFYAIRSRRSLNIIYRLPTAYEWEFAASAGMQMLYNQGVDSKGRALLHVAREQGVSQKTPQLQDLPVRADKFAPNVFGIYNMFGNVAELTDSTSCKGGSFAHPLSSCRPGNSVYAGRPASWLGFRCVCIVR